jgi:hypothetical protein
MDETLFPIDYFADDPAAKALIDKMNIPSEEIKDIAKSVLSVKVQGIKAK